MQDSFNQVPIRIHSLAHLKLLHGLVTDTHLQSRVASAPHKLQVTLGNGRTLLDQDVVEFASGASPLPEGLYCRHVYLGDPGTKEMRPCDTPELCVH